MIYFQYHLGYRSERLWGKKKRPMLNKARAWIESVEPLGIKKKQFSLPFLKECDQMCSLCSAFPRTFLFFFFFEIKSMHQMPKPQTTIPIIAKEIKI